MTPVRIFTGLAGLGLGLWGVWLLLDLPVAKLVNIAVWLAGGVVAHDFLLAPLVIAVGVVVVRRLPSRARPPYVVAAVVVGSVTLAVFPTLARFGAKADDPTLLNRSYLAFWVGFVVVAFVIAAGFARRRARKT